MAEPLRFCDVWPPCEPELRPWYVVLGEGIAGPYGEQEDLLMAGEDVVLGNGLRWQRSAVIRSLRQKGMTAETAEAWADLLQPAPSDA